MNVDILRLLMHKRNKTENITNIYGRKYSTEV